MKHQVGFTLIELIVVIVILGLLATIAIPLYIDIRNDAAAANVRGVAGALSSGSAINFAARTANSANGSAVTDCSNVSGTLAGAALPSAPSGGTYTVAGGAIGSGAVVTCTLTLTNASPASVSASFEAIGIP